MNITEITKGLKNLLCGIANRTSALANASAYLYEILPDVSWLGFYLADGETLVLGPFQGRVACTEIPFSRGVCGAAASSRRTVSVPDVHRFPGHIACDSRSRSEIVVPIITASSKLVGVLDVDSESLSRFGEVEARLLEAAARVIAEEVFG